MTAWIIFSVLVKVVCAVSSITIIVGLVKAVKGFWKKDELKGLIGMLLAAVSSIVCVVTLFGAGLVDAAIRVFF